MKMIFVFGYDERYPGGDDSDLIALVNNHGGGNTTARGDLQPDVLAQALRTAEKPRYDHVTVMHLRDDGTPGLVEHWQPRYAAPGAPLAANQVQATDMCMYEQTARTTPAPTVPVFA